MVKGLEKLQRALTEKIEAGGVTVIGFSPWSHGEGAQRYQAKVKLKSGNDVHHIAVAVDVDQWDSDSVDALAEALLNEAMPERRAEAQKEQGLGRLKTATLVFMRELMGVAVLEIRQDVVVKLIDEVIYSRTLQAKRSQGQTGLSAKKGEDGEGDGETS